MKCVGCLLPLVLTVALMFAGAWFWHTQGENILNSLIGEHVAHEEMAILAEFEERVTQLTKENEQLQQQAAHVSELQTENESLKQQQQQVGPSSSADHTQVEQLQKSIQQMSKLAVTEK